MAPTPALPVQLPSDPWSRMPICDSCLIEVSAARRGVIRYWRDMLSWLTFRFRRGSRLGSTIVRITRVTAAHPCKVAECHLARFVQTPGTPDHYPVITWQ